jgi:membrane protein implicated in regulation of membrane protease activity
MDPLYILAILAILTLFGLAVMWPKQTVIRFIVIATIMLWLHFRFDPSLPVVFMLTVVLISTADVLAYFVRRASEDRTDS